ncbi:MAG: hypothetical protein EBS05_21765, partial [Proteobacteria bacterium]|nr:hypothetical protein [Pseudomonadota bacterium]
AQYALGERLLRGSDGKADVIEAYQWHGRAASNGLVAAQLRMGMKHERAVAGVLDIAEAARWYELAAAQGSDAARFRLGCIHSLNRYGGRMDGNATVHWIQPLVDRRHEPARRLWQAAAIVLRATNVPPAQLRAYLQQEAEAGGAAEQQVLANHLLRSDPQAATYWWEVSRLGGNTNVSLALAQAQLRLTDAELAAERARAKQFQPVSRPALPPVRLGNLDAVHPLEVELQPTPASRAELARLEQAAQGGEAGAQFQLGLVHQLAPAFSNQLAALDGSIKRGGNGITTMVLNNDRVPQPHLEEAVKWYTAAAKQGHRDAAWCLFWLYHSGVLGTVRTVEAMPWLKVAAEAGHGESAYRLHQFRLARFGYQPSRDPEVEKQYWAETSGWLHKAAALGYPPAVTNLAAQLFAAGDQAASLQMLRAAAARGDADAQAKLRELFGIGPGTPAQPTEAGKPATMPRLAIVPLAETLRPLADLLTAELGANPGVVLVERAEIDRVFKEQALNTANVRTAKLGELLNAQGLILLETNAPPSVRLIAVAPGVVLSATELSLPITNASDWSRQLTVEFTPLLGKLAVARGAAVPVSLLGLRMATFSADGAEIEAGLAGLFVYRLSREPAVFALERRRLEQLSAEEELTGQGNNFWSGASLVDGAIDRDPNDRTRLTVRLQLTPAGGQKLELAATGSTTNLAALADSLVIKLLAGLKTTPAGTWNPQEEAIRFYNEARWLDRWGQWGPALTAMESAWALGLRGPIHATFRLQLLLDNVPSSKLRWPGSPDHPSFLRQPPGPAELDTCARAITAFNSRSPVPGEEVVWWLLGVVTLEMSARTLDAFYHAPEHRAGHLEQLAQLRTDTRNLFARLQTANQQAKSPWRWDLLGYQFRTRMGAGNRDTVGLLGLEVLYLRYWAERPQEVLDLHARLLGQADYGQWRGYFDSAKPTPLAAWTPAERAGLPALWAAHRQGLASSTNLAGVFEQALAAVNAVDNSPWQTAEPMLAAAFSKFLDLAWEQREALTRQTAGAHTITTSLAACRQRFQFYHGSTGHEPAGARLEALVAGYEKRLRTYQAEFGGPLAAAYLREKIGKDANTLKDSAQLDDLLARPPFTVAQAQELLPLVKAVTAPFHPQLMPKGLADGLRHITELASLTGGANPVVTQPPAKVAAPTPGEPAADALRVTRFWLAPELRRPVQDFTDFPLTRPYKVDGRGAEVSDWSWQNDRLWVAWRHGMLLSILGTGQGDGFFYHQNCSHIAGYSLPDLAGDLNPDSLPAAVALQGPERYLPHQPAGRFTVVGGQTYLSAMNAVWRISKGASAPLKLELTGEPLLASVHGRLMISAPDELYAYDVKTDTAELLASGRRRPALNLADPGALGVGQVVELPRERMRVLFPGGRGVFEFDFASRQWKFVAQAPGQTHLAHADGWQSHGGGGNGHFTLYWLPHTATNWQNAALRLPDPPRDLQTISANRVYPKVPLWFPRDRSLSPVGLASTSLSNCFWSVTGLDFHRGYTNGDTFILSSNGCHLRLAAWRADLTQPAVVPLWLELPANTLAPAQVAKAQGHRAQDQLATAPGTVLAVPPGLVYRSEAVPGFWFIPWSDVLPRVEAQFAQLVAARDARPDPGTNRVNQLMRTYDLDGDGKLNGVEFAMLSGAEFGPPAIGTDLGSIFMNADKNKDGGLDSKELAALLDLRKAAVARGPGIPFPPGFGGPGAGARPPGFPTPPGFPGGPGGRFGPGAMPSGPPPPEILERYDKNKNGKLDPDEMQEFLRDQMRGMAPRPRGTNAPPAAPVPPSPK